MDNGGFSHGRVADHFRVNHSIIVRLMQRVRQTGNVTDRPRASRPRKTTPRDDRLISRRERQRPFSTAGALRGNLAFGGHISTRTVIRRLHHQGMRARRPITRPQLTLRHRHARFYWPNNVLVIRVNRETLNMKINVKLCAPSTMLQRCTQYHDHLFEIT